MTTKKEVTIFKAVADIKVMLAEAVEEFHD